MTKSYPVVLYAVQENGSSSYSALAPDFPGCISSGPSLQEALKNMRQALDLHLQALIESGETVPEPSTVDEVRKGNDAEAIYGVIDLPLSEIQEKALARKSTRINVTFPGDLLHDIDEYCEQNGLARSRFFQLLAERFLTNTPNLKDYQQPQNTHRGERTPLDKESADTIAQWQKLRPHFETLCVPSAKLIDALRQRDVIASSPAESPSPMLFAFYLINAFWALESWWLPEKTRTDPSKTPTLDPSR